jgi:hypothetical protein
MLPDPVTTHVKGAWTELFSATDINATLVDLIVAGTGASGQDRHMLCDIGIGSAGNETVLVSNIYIGCTNGMRRYTIPIWIPSGSRVVVRCQTLSLLFATGVQMALHNTGHLQADTGSSATTYGANTVTSGGTPATAAASINTLSAWTELSAAISSSIRSMLVVVGGPAGSAWNAAEVLADIGYGTSGNEQVLISRLPLSWGTTEMAENTSLTIPVSLPAGTRLVVRYQSTLITHPPTFVLVGVT